MLTFAPVACSNRWFAWFTTAGQPFFASLCSQTVTVLPLPSVDGDALFFAEELPELLHAETVNASVAVTATAPAMDRFTPASMRVGCASLANWRRRILA